MAFLGPVTDRLLKGLLQSPDSFTIEAAMMILGRRFVESGERYRVNSDITSRFVASLLDLQASKEMIAQLSHLIFKSAFLQGLEVVLVASHLGEGIPLPRDLLRPTVELHPFIPDIYEPRYWMHRFYTKTAYDFLKRMYHLVPTQDSKCLSLFAAYED